jgi:hypothetical protein
MLERGICMKVLSISAISKLSGVSVRELLRLRASSNNSCGSVRTRGEEKITIVEKKIIEPQRIKNALEILASACSDGDAPTSTCPILDALDPDNEEPI